MRACVATYVRMYICLYECMHACIHARTHERTHTVRPVSTIRRVCVTFLIALCMYISLVSMFSIDDVGVLSAVVSSQSVDGLYNFTAVVTDGRGARKRQNTSLVSVRTRCA